MFGTLFSSCFLALLCATAPEPRSGCPRSDGCTGWIDLLLYIHEECYIRIGEVFNGKIIAITEDTITIQKWRSVARVFRVSPTVASKRIPLPQSVGTGHRLGQVCVGDMVCFDLAHARDGYVCVALGIYRRPGGTIPEAEDDHLPAKSRIHNRRGAEQFVEEVFAPKVIPHLLLRFSR